MIHEIIINKGVFPRDKIKIPIAVAVTVPIHQICRDSRAAAVIPGNTGGSPIDGAKTNTAKPIAPIPKLYLKVTVFAFNKKIPTINKL